MIARVPVRSVDGHDVAERWAEPELAASGEKALLAGGNVHALHHPLAALEDVVKDDTLSAGGPLLTGGAMGVLAGNAAGQHFFLAGRALANADFAVVAF